MDTIGVRELKQNASAVLARVRAGESFVVTDRGMPIARLTPLGLGRLSALRDAGLTRRPTVSPRDLSPPLQRNAAGAARPTMTELVRADRDAERS